MVAIQNTAELRSLNKKKIIETLRARGNMTKKEIADAAGLSFSTVSSLCNQLEQDDFLRYEDDASSNGGRVPKLLSINPNGWFLVSVNLVREGEVRIVLSNMLGERAQEWVQASPELGEYGAMIGVVNEGVEQLLARGGVGADRLLGACVAVPGIHDRISGLIVNSTVQFLNGHMLASDLQQQLHLPLHVENESNLLALAALQQHDELGAGNLLYLYVGEGLGSGIVENRMLVTGAHGYGSEIGHIPLGRHGYGCYCGESGCIETEVSIGGFVRKFMEISREPMDEALAAVQKWKVFVAQVKAGNEQALFVVREIGHLLGTLLSVLINLLDPDDVYIGGYIEDIFEEIRDEILAEAHKRLVVARGEDIRLHCTRGYNRLITAGCTELTMMRWRP